MDGLNLEFVILSTIVVIDKNNKALDFFSPLLEKAIDYSKDSSLSWIIYVLMNMGIKEHMLFYNKVMKLKKKIGQDFNNYF